MIPMQISGCDSQCPFLDGLQLYRLSLLILYNQRFLYRKPCTSLDQLFKIAALSVQCTDGRTRLYAVCHLTSVDRKEQACVSGCYDHQQVPYLLPTYQSSSLGPALCFLLFLSCSL